MSDRSQNDLRDFFADQYEGWIYPNRKVIGGLVIFVCVMLIVLFFVSRSNANYKALGWEKFFTMLTSSDPITPLEQFATIKDGYFEYQSAIVAGQMLLSQACSAGFSEKPQATEKLGKALVLFQNVHNNRKTPTKFKRQAALGIAQVHEAMAGVHAGSHDIELAISEYKKIVTLWQGEYEAKIAEKQLELITRESIKKFYDRYATAVVEPDPGDFKIEIDKNSTPTPNPNSQLLEDLFNTSPPPATQKSEPKETNSPKETDPPKENSPTQKSESKETPQ
ncbi:MAG: hypothetical protein LBC74_00065 [Planctomycetaceae bacterium]|jgi:hypothetical protein|nr:hypothetical protein [Planctomycetaceae bacterium]